VKRYLLPIGAILAALFLVVGGSNPHHLLQPEPAAAAGGCGLAQPAFCDTFDAPTANPAGSRSGELNGVVWGVSRLNVNNPSQGLLDSWAPSGSLLPACNGTSGTVLPERDHRICNGRFVESTNDAGGVTTNAAYPKQPFDWAGRTGIVTFDVDTFATGIHGAWPSFAITNKPAPAPDATRSNESLDPQYALGFSLAATCGAGTSCGGGPGCPYPSPDGVTVDKMYVVNEYAYSEVPVTMTACVQAQPGTLSHFEVHVSVSQVSVWATEPGTSAPLKQIAVSGSLSLPFTRGLIWIEDSHYNAAKFGQPSDADHTFQWDNVGFDGPVLPRDLAYDVPDALTPAPGGGVNLGYAVAGGTPTALSVTGLADPAQASAALLTLNFYPTTSTAAFQYRVNGNAWHSSGWPWSGVLWSWFTAALPVPLTELHSGTNTIELQLGLNDTWTFANLDVILVGAGGGGSGSPAGVGTPGAVSLQSPAEGAIGVSLTPTLAWTAASGASEYTVYVWDPGANVMAYQTTTAALSATVPAGSALSPGRFYYWTVQACSGATCGQTARWEGFTTQFGIGVPALTAPAEGATGVSLTPAIAWTPVSGATQYTAYVWDPGAGAMAYQATTTATQISVPQASALQPGRFYYYTALACNGGGCGPVARWEGFTTATSIGVPGLLAPAEGSTGNGATPTIRWTAAAGTGPSTQYTVYVWDPVALAMLVQQSTVGQSFTVPASAGLVSGQFYYYTVQACNGASCGPLARWEGFTS